MLALARRCGFLRKDGVQRFQATLEGHRQDVSAIYGNLFLTRDQKLKEEVHPSIYFFFDRSANPDLIKDMLSERHFVRVDAAYDNLVLLAGRPAQGTSHGTIQAAAGKNFSASSPGNLCLSRPGYGSDQS